jgi:hydroxyacylglutathione hydrolase
MPVTTVGYELRHGTALGKRDDERAFVEFILAGQPATPRYFVRMKHGNRDGVPDWSYRAPPMLTTVPADSVILDVRPERVRGARPVAGALAAPLDASFPSVAGSYLDADARIALVARPEDVELATRVLARMGYTDVVGTVDPLAIPAATPSRTVRFVDIPAGASVLDVRTEDEWRSGHIPGSLNVPHTRVIAERAKLPRGPVYVHCQSGGRAHVAVAALRAHGVDAILVDEPFAAYAGERA